MTASVPMAERHAFALERLAEMTGKLVEVAYARALRPGEGDAQERAMLLFDRLARGFRLTLALEARMDRDRRRDAAGIGADAAPRPDVPRPDVPRLPPPVAGPRPARPVSPAREDDHERDADLEPSDLPGLVQGLRIMVAEHADILDPDGAYAQALDRWSGEGRDVLPAPADPAERLGPAGPAARPPQRPSGRDSLRRASG